MIRKKSTPNKQKVLEINMEIDVDPEVNAQLQQQAHLVAEAFKRLEPSLTLHWHQWSRAQVSQNPMAYIRAVDAWRATQKDQHIRISRDNPTVKGLPDVFMNLKKRPLCRFCGQPFHNYKILALQAGQ